MMKHAEKWYSSWKPWYILKRSYCNDVKYIWRTRKGMCVSQGI